MAANLRQILKPTLLLGKFTRNEFKIQTRNKSSLAPTQDFFEKPSLMFSSSAIKRNWDVIPIIAITLGGLVIETCYIIHLALTRDDVRWTPASTMNCEIPPDMKHLDKPPIRKMLVINQKYEWPQGLIDALREPTQEELDQMKAEKQKQQKSSWFGCCCKQKGRRAATNDNKPN